MSDGINKGEPERVPLEETGDEKIAGEAVMLMSNKESNDPRNTEAEEADNNNVQIPIAEEEMKEEPKVERENDADASEDDDDEENDDEEEEEEEEEESNSKAYDDLKKSENCQTISIVNKVEKHESDMVDDNNEDGTEEEQATFMRELENFHKEMVLEFKPPKFYGEGLNCLKLWRAVTKLGGYDQVTACKLWRQVGESFNPPKTCTTISWSFRCFYEKALLEYEKHKIRMGDLEFSIPLLGESTSLVNMPKIATQSSGSGRTIRDAAARAMQGWHSQRFHGNGEISDPIIKDKNSVSLAKHDKQHKTSGIIKRKKVPSFERFARPARPKITTDSVMDTVVDDFGPPADWVKINVLKTKDCFEVYALVPGLLREEVRVQSDPGGRLVISGEPEHLDNPWGVTPFKKIITLPSRIDPYKTSAVVTLHGQLFVRVPFEPSDL